MAKVQVTLEIEDRAVARYWSCDGPDDLANVHASARDMVRDIISPELYHDEFDIVVPE